MFQVTDILPTRLGVSHIGRPITSEELNAGLLAARAEQDKKTSQDLYAFNNPALKDIHAFVSNSCGKYIEEAYAPDTGLEFFITQSWYTFLDSDESIHRHTHSNCLFSGTFYLDCEHNDSIVFHTDRYVQMSIVTNEPKVSELYSKSIRIKPGQIVIFPSHVPHSVPAIKRTKTRVCLAFNVFAKGYFGNEMSINALYI